MRAYRFGSIAGFLLLLPLGAVSAVHADVTYEASASASVLVLTPAVPGRLQITITPGLSLPATLTDAAFPADAATEAFALESPSTQGIADSVQIFGEADGAPGQSATSIAGAQDQGAMLIVTNLTLKPLIYTVVYNVQAQSDADFSRPDETVAVAAFAQVELNNSAPDGTTLSLPAGQSQVWTITAFAGGTAFSPATPEPGTLAFLGSIGLSGATFAFRRLRRR
jgi:hypothetical protein